jgi:hypothetical protein
MKLEWHTKHTRGKDALLLSEGKEKGKFADGVNYAQGYHCG